MKPKMLPNYYFKDWRNNCALHTSVHTLGVKGREVPDELTRALANHYDAQTMGCIHIPHWHQISKDDGRNLRNFLKVDPETGNPKHHSRDYDLLQYNSMCMQFIDEEYAQYVQTWCERQVSCLDDPKDDF